MKFNPGRQFKDKLQEGCSGAAYTTTVKIVRSVPHTHVIEELTLRIPEQRGDCRRALAES